MIIIPQATRYPAGVVGDYQVGETLLPLQDDDNYTTWAHDWGYMQCSEKAPAMLHLGTLVCNGIDTSSLRL